MNQALDAFVAKKREFDALIAELARASEDHFFAAPDEISWGDVSSLEHWLGRVRDVADSIYRRGEYAAQGGGR